MIHQNRQSLTTLRLQWLTATTIYAVVLLVGYRYTLQAWHSVDAIQWLILATATAFVQMGILWWALQYNHRPTEATLLSFLGYGNSLTLVRGLLTCLLAGFLFAPLPTALLAWAPAVLYSLERLVDFFDGYVARVTNRETKLGSILDIEFDGLGILIAVALAVQYGKLPAWYLVLGVARQLFVAGMWLRHRQGLPVAELPPSDHRRVIAGFQTGFISVTLWPILSPQITLLAGYLFAIPLIFSFGRDWLVVSGVIDAGSPIYQKVRTYAKQFLEGWLPLAARLGGTGLALYMLWPTGTVFSGKASSIAWAGGGAHPLITAEPHIWAVAALLLLLGVVGRLAAVVLVALACADMLASGLYLGNELLLACAIIVAHLGSGKFALWKPEEHFIHTRLGAASTAKS
ncbi:MAG: CDP-alcohol phosphatidyltransferase family protein [Caldilineaceae bacterium]|nr:CDP-alcohol phosphatidyltransferase family protein [Caldilineaceae bacterium]